MKFKKALFCLLSMLLLVSVLCLPVFANENKQDYNNVELYPGGMPFGAKIVSNGLTVVKFSSTQGKDTSSAYKAGIRQGDLITKINGKCINTIDEFVKQIDNCGGKELTITILRDNKEMNFSVTPKYSSDDGKYKTGIWVKDSTSGIGTVTFICPDTQGFGGLGHAICDSSTGKPVNMTNGTVMNVAINGVVKGQVGVAGELKGCFLNKKIGTLTKNTDCGVFGLLSSTNSENVAPMKLCTKENVKEGKAYIICTLDKDGPKKYDIEIYSIDSSNSPTKNFRIRVTDRELIEKAGGIVQGMSGSPIIQDGRLVGAVTHVLINDPTQGYGIFIENMLDAMPSILK